MDLPDNIVARLFTESRDARRPALEDILKIIEGAFGQMNIAVKRVVDGPPMWMWEDEEMSEIGFPRFYGLSTSQSDGVEGYPLFTIRQAYSVRFDTWVSFSTLVLGPDDESIARSIALAIAHHSGAFAGVKYVAGTIAANRASPMAGMVAVAELLGASPPIVSLEKEEGLEDEAKKELKSNERVVN